MKSNKEMGLKAPLNYVILDKIDKLTRIEMEENFEKWAYIIGKELGKSKFHIKNLLEELEEEEQEEFEEFKQEVEKRIEEIITEQVMQELEEQENEENEY